MTEIACVLGWVRPVVLRLLLLLETSPTPTPQAVRFGVLLLLLLLLLVLVAPWRADNEAEPGATEAPFCAVVLRAFSNSAR